MATTSEALAQRYVHPLRDKDAELLCADLIFADQTDDARELAAQMRDSFLNAKWCTEPISFRDSERIRHERDERYSYWLGMWHALLNVTAARDVRREHRRTRRNHRKAG